MSSTACRERRASSPSRSSFQLTGPILPQACPGRTTCLGFTGEGASLLSQKVRYSSVDNPSGESPMLEHLSDSLRMPLLLAVAGSGPASVRLHAVSGLLIGLACCGIAVALVLLARLRRDRPFRGMFWMFAAFIL